MATYGGYIDGMGVTKTLREVLTAVDTSAEEQAKLDALMALYESGRQKKGKRN